MRPQHRDNYQFLTQAPVSRVILTMAVPTIVSMLVTCLYTIVDTYFVGRLNTQSTAAVGIVFSLMCLIQAMGSFFGHGSGSYMSRELGARRNDNAATMAATGFVCHRYRCGYCCNRLDVAPDVVGMAWQYTYGAALYGAIYGYHLARYTFSDSLLHS